MKKHFYVLSLYGKPLDGEDVDWGLFLQVDADCYPPLSISSVDLPPEYKFFFGKCLNKFKVSYKVTFDACDIEGKPILTPETECFKLVFRSSEKEAHLSWDVIALSVEYDLGYPDCVSSLPSV